MVLEGRQSSAEVIGAAAVVAARSVTRTFVGPEGEIHAVDGVDLDVFAGESVAVVGPSGSGKSTLLHLLGLLDSPTRGSIRLGKSRYADLSQREADQLRLRMIGFVFQQPHLIRHLDLVENVAMPLWYVGMARGKASAIAMDRLRDVGLSDRMRHRPGQLSGGQRQRAVMARAMVLRPRVLLADEPTGSLDRASADSVGNLLLSAAGQGCAVVIATHDERLASRCRRIVRMDDGRIVGREPMATCSRPS